MPVERSPELDAIVRDGQTRYLVNGHMHYRVVIDFADLVLVNAGTLTARHRPGVSVVDFASGAVSAHEFVGDRVGDVVAEHPLAPDTSRRIWSDTQEFDGRWTPVTLY
jgi:hypothetical protein